MAAAQLMLFPEPVVTDTSTPLLAPVRVQSGELWALGRHRLLCGDATNAGDVARLMGGVKVYALLTDPPFNVGFSYQGAYAGRDNKSVSAYGKWLRKAIHNAEGSLAEGSSVFIWQAMLNVQHFHKWFMGHDWRLFAACKNFVQMRPTWMQYAWDPVVFWTHGSRPRKPYAMRDWHMAITSNTRPTPERRLTGEHPCPRPHDTLAWLIEQVTRMGDSVLDLFLGSGTTLIACERTGRICYGIEIEPRYCDIILRRWEQATGQTAILLDRPAA